jgi:hypothetical protein
MHEEFRWSRAASVGPPKEPGSSTYALPCFATASAAFCAASGSPR